MNRCLALVGTGVLVACAGTARADFLLNLNTRINGTLPTGPSYTYMTALFQSTATDTVELTLTNLMPTTNFITYFNFNLDPSKSASYLNGLQFTLLGGNQALVNRNWNLLDDPNDLKAGYFDIQFEWPTSSVDPNRFSGNEISKYKIQGAGLTAESFRFLSLPQGNNSGGYFAAAKIQGYGNSASVGTTSYSPPPGGNSVPEPFTMGLGFAAAGIFVRRRVKATKV